MLIVMGTRPEAIKLAPVVAALRRRGAQAAICTTGQHPDLLPPALADFGYVADHQLAWNGDWRASLPPLQMLVRKLRPLGVIVQGDTFSALAGGMAARLEGVPLHHVEAGLRSGDVFSPFPEEICRTGLGRIADTHFTPTASATDALLNEGIATGSIHRVGNTIVDALRMRLRRLNPPAPAGIDARRKLVLLTVHRRESVGEGTRAILRAAVRIAADPAVQLIYPVHPRTRGEELEALGSGHAVQLVEPLPYAEFLPLLARAALVLTDSGGIQEEAAVLGTPLVCLRSVTERPEALDRPQARLCGTDEEAIVAAAAELLAQRPDRRPSAAFGDGNAAERIAEILLSD